ELRHSSSLVRGRIINTHHDQWQQVAELIQTLAEVHGSIVKIDLSQSNTHYGWLYFELYYDSVGSGKKFCNFIEKLNTLQPPNIQDLVYLETPAQGPAPGPAPGPTPGPAPGPTPTSN
ncbi:unnamed protein product, partial [Rotaria magnacalcarata]